MQQPPQTYTIGRSVRHTGERVVLVLNTDWHAEYCNSHKIVLVVMTSQQLPSLVKFDTLTSVNIKTDVTGCDAVQIGTQLLAFFVNMLTWRKRQQSTYSTVYNVVRQFLRIKRQNLK